jgi:hypothetical protein
MMSFARLLFVFLLTLLVVLIGVGIFLPDSVRVSRQATIQASAETIYSQIADLKQFQAWSPWANLAKNVTYTYEGPASGKGATQRWQITQGDEITTGYIEVTDAKTNQRVEMRMVFSDKQSGMMTFELEPTLQQSNNLIWTFETQFGWDLFSRYVGLFLDDMIGKNYERGLETLKQRAESL